MAVPTPPLFIPLTIHDAPLTAEQAREIFGPHVDSVIQRLIERIAREEITSADKETA